jgi:hypothetical protein
MQLDGMRTLTCRFTTECSLCFWVGGPLGTMLGISALGKHDRLTRRGGEQPMVDSNAEK